MADSPAFSLRSLARDTTRSLQAFKTEVRGVLGLPLPSDGVPVGGIGGGGRRGMVGGFLGQLMQKLLSGDSYDYKSKAGNLWENSIVAIVLNWLQRVYSEAPRCVEKLKAGQWHTSFDHEILDLLQNPNEFWDGNQLDAAMVLSWIADGNVYLIKLRSDARKVTELWWVPWWMMEPAWDAAGHQFITHYEYTVDGVTYIVPTSEVVHLRCGVDLKNIRKGRPDAQAVLREICGDNEAVVFHCAILANMGIPGLIFTPKEAMGKLEDDEVATFKRDFKEKFSGKRAGEPFILYEPWEVHNPALSPDNLALDKLIRFYESRITAALGVPAVVLGTLVGLETSTAKASYKDSLKQAYVSCLMPLHRWMDGQMTRQLMRDFDKPGRSRLARDYSNVWALAEDFVALFKALAVACGGPFMTPDEARTRAKLSKLSEIDRTGDPDDYEGSQLRSTPAAPQKGDANGDPGAANDSNAD